jgi:hypothetical protein
MISMARSDFAPTSFSLRKPFEELPLFWQCVSGFPFRSSRIDGEFEITFDRDGEWQISDLWIKADNGKVRSEEVELLIQIDGDINERFFLTVADAVTNQYHTRIEDWIQDELCGVVPLYERVA